jgi:hypothetical protein
MRHVIPAEWTEPSFWKSAESCSGLDTIARVTLSWVVNITAHVALVFAHVSLRLDPTACKHDNSPCDRKRLLASKATSYAGMRGNGEIYPD